MNEKSAENREWPYRLNETGLFICTSVSLLFMHFFIILGLVTMAVGMWTMIRNIVPSFRIATAASQSPHAEGFALGAALDGLEFIFLAPLPFLLLRGIWDFVDRVREVDSQASANVTASPAFLIRIKGLIIGLMIAVVATELLKKSVSEHGLSYEPAIAGSIFIGVLAAYAFLIERSSAQS